MSARVPLSWRRLGVTDPQADKADLRRAYARKLKQIDPDQDRAAFEALRADYEMALAVSARRESDAGPIPETISAPDPARASAVSALADLQRAQDVPRPDADFDTDFGTSFGAGFDRPLPPLSPEDRAAEEARALAAQAAAEATERLEARLRKSVSDGTEIATIAAILRDPALNDPEVAKNIERPLYQFLCDRIEAGANGLPRFRFETPGRRYHAGDARFRGTPKALAALTRQIDGHFGWFSDGVRMSRGFPSYPRLVAATAALTTKPGFRARLGWLGRVNGTGLWLACMALAGVLRLIHDLPAQRPQPVSDMTKAIAYGEQIDEVYQDMNFLRPLPGAYQPSAGTMQFLRDILRDEGIVREETLSPMMVYLRAGIAAQASGSFTPESFRARPEGDALLYLFGTLLAARYTAGANLGYRDTALFNLSPNRESDLWLWTQKSFDPTFPTLWQGQGGYALVRSEIPKGINIAVYPEPFLREMVRSAQGDAHVLEGALGLSFDAFASFLDLRLHFYPQVHFPKVDGAPILPARHALALTGLDQNRRPIRVIRNDARTCDWPAGRLTQAWGFSFRCD